MRGKATEGNMLGGMALGTGEMRDDTTGQGHGSDASSSSSPSNLRCISSGLGVLAEVRTGQDTTKKLAHLLGVAVRERNALGAVWHQGQAQL